MRFFMAYQGVVIVAAVVALVAVVIIGMHPMWEKRRFIHDVAADIVGEGGFAYTEMEYSTMPVKDPDEIGYFIIWTIRVDADAYRKFKDRSISSDGKYYINPQSNGKVYICSNAVYHL